MLEAVRAKMREGHTRVVLGAATGSGKTACAAEIVRSANAKGNRCLFLADRRSLIRQTMDRLGEWGIETDPWFGGEHGDGEQANIVGTYQTWAARKPPGEFGLVVVDECHVRVGDGAEFKPQSAKAVLDHYSCPAVGLTATPFKPGMGDVWDALVYPVTTDELVDKEFLIRPQVWTPSTVDVSGLKVGGNGEWQDDDLDERLSVVVDDIVGRYVDRVNDRFGGKFPRTLVFAPSAASCESLATQFSDTTGQAFHSISYLESKTNESRIAAFRAGEVTGLVSRDMVGRGFDVPDIQFVVLARPFRKAVGEVVQQIGRGMRTADGKTMCVVHDHAGNFIRMGGAIDWFWKHGVSKFELPKRGTGEMPVKTCPECDAVVPMVTAKCPECGYEFGTTAKQAVRRDFVEWARNSETEERLNEAARALLAEIGLDAFCEGLVHAREKHAKDKHHARRMASAMLYSLTGTKRTSRWFESINGSPDERITAISDRSYKLWKSAKRMESKFGAKQGDKAA